MPWYLTLSRGPRADAATPVLASSDPSVVHAVLEAIARLGDRSDDAGAAPDYGRGVLTRFPDASRRVEP